MEKLPFPPEQASYVYQPSKDIVSIELDGGLSRSRRDIVGSAAILDVSWVLDMEEYQYFMAFYNFNCKHGALPFLIDLLLDTSTLEEYTCKFVANSLRMERPFGHSRGIVAQLEAIPIDDSAFDEMTILIYELGKDGEFFEALTKLVNVDWHIPYPIGALNKLVNIDMEIP